MTEKNIFAYKLFLSLNISDFNLFLMWKLQPPPWKTSPPLSQRSPSRSWGPVKPLLFENLVGSSTPPPYTLQKRWGGGAHCVKGEPCEPLEKHQRKSMFSPELQACSYVENALCYRCFSRNLAKIYISAILKNFFFWMYAKQKTVEYSLRGVFNPLMLVVAKEHT